MTPWGEDCAQSVPSATLEASTRGRRDLAMTDATPEKLDPRLIEVVVDSIIKDLSESPWMRQELRGSLNFRWLKEHASASDPRRQELVELKLRAFDHIMEGGSHVRRVFDA